jgi:hypothetical protein
MLTHFRCRFALLPLFLASVQCVSFSLQQDGWAAVANGTIQGKVTGVQQASTTATVNGYACVHGVGVPTSLLLYLGGKLQSLEPTWVTTDPSISAACGLTSTQLNFQFLISSMTAADLDAKVLVKAIYKANAKAKEVAVVLPGSNDYALGVDWSNLNMGSVIGLYCTTQEQGSGFFKPVHAATAPAGEVFQLFEFSVQEVAAAGNFLGRWTAGASSPVRPSGTSPGHLIFGPKLASDQNFSFTVGPIIGDGTVIYKGLDMWMQYTYSFATGKLAWSGTQCELPDGSTVPCSAGDGDLYQPQGAFGIAYTGCELGLIQ